MHEYNDAEGEPDEDGDKTLLHIACSNGSIGEAIVRLLLACETVDVNARTTQGAWDHTPLLLACKVQNELGGDGTLTQENVRDMTPVDKGELVKILLLHADIDPNAGLKSDFGADSTETPLVLASTSGNLAHVQWLLAHPKMKINKCCYTRPPRRDHPRSGSTVAPGYSRENALSMAKTDEIADLLRAAGGLMPKDVPMAEDYSDSD